MNLRQLSEKLQLSQTTVSRALNGYPEVRDATRIRVLDAAKRYNYRPNARAQSLATGRAMAIGHVITSSRHNEIVSIIFADFIGGAGEVYAEHGYNMVLSVVRDEDEMQSYRDIAQKGVVDGIIVHGPTCNDPRIDLLNELKMPFVVHGRSTEVTTDYSWLDVNSKRALERSTQFLLDLGHTRIGLVNGLEWMDFALRRRKGYLEALAACQIAADDALMRSSEMTESYGYASATEMLELDDPATAFIAASIVPALGIRRAVEERGLRIGKDVSIICFDDQISYLSNGDREPIYTAPRSSVRAAGRQCARMLIKQIQSPGNGPQHELWEADLVVGQSTGPAPVKRPKSSGRSL